MQDAPHFTFVLFGATGDLAMRKILPALYAAHHGDMLAEVEHGKIVAVARGVLNKAAYLQWIDKAVRPYADAFDADTWDSFLQRIEYVQLDLLKREDFVYLRDALKHIDGSLIFYLATGPSLFMPICQALAELGLNQNARIVLEKPLGYDLASSQAINDAAGEIFAESQIYRIDHYLGKEPVQNLLALRFGNVLFEPLWRREWVSSIQITIAEEMGVEGRSNSYDQMGALRDMVQNHLLQLLAIVAMEPPHSMESRSVRNEKLRVLNALKPILPNQVEQSVVRGQYQAGLIKGKAVPAYNAEPGIKKDSVTETFVALKVEIENWRWAGVPFFLRTGKRLAKRGAEIVINFRQVPHSALGTTALQALPNRLVMQLQPNESIHLYCLAKQPGEGMNLANVHLDLAFDDFFKEKQMDAYQRLLLDVIHGRLALFVRRDEQEQAWRWVEPILEGWAASGQKPEPYAAGSWGPAAAHTLLAQHGAAWLEEEP